MPGLLTTAQMTAIRAIATSILDGTCTIKRNPNLDVDGDAVSDVLGQLLSPSGSTPSWTVIASGVACGFYEPTQNMLTMVGAQIAQQATWLLSLPYGTDIRVGDRVTSGSDEFQVHTVISPRTYTTLAQALVGKVA